MGDNKMINESCTDNRFEIINRAKKHIIESTNIDMSPDEMKVLDNFLFRCWQMGWLKKYETMEDGIYLEFFAVSNNTRYNAKVVNMREAASVLTHGIMDGLEKLCL